MRPERRRRLPLAAPALLCAALALAGCGSSSSKVQPPSAAQLRVIAQANTICRGFNAQVEALASPTSQAQVTAFAVTLQHHREAELKSLRALGTEPARPSGYDTFIIDLAAIDQLYGELIAGSKSGESEVPAAASERGSALAAALGQEQAKLKLRDCAKNPAASTHTSSGSGSG